MLKIILLAVSLLSISCASTKKTKSIAGMAVGFVGGYAIGAAATPEGENKKMHGALYGAAASSLVAAGLIYMMDDSKEKQQQIKINLMADEIEVLKKNKREINNGSINPGINNLPGDLRALISPGNWKLYEIDEWVKKGNTLIHQDKELSFEPSKLK